MWNVQKKLEFRIRQTSGEINLKLLKPRTLEKRHIFVELFW